MNNMQMSNDVTILTLHIIFQVEAHESYTYTAVVLAFDARRVPPSVQNLLGTRWGIHPHSIDETSNMINMFPSSAHHQLNQLCESVSLRLLQGLNEKVIDGKPGESQIIHEEIDKYPLVNIQKTMENHHF